MFQKGIEAEAYIFAKRAHEAVNQKRKYTGESYIIHPVRVATWVKAVPHSEMMVVIALLHDTVEDTNTTFEDIHTRFGNEISCGVWWLTDISRPSDGNRRTRKAIDRDHVAAAPAHIQTIKLADLIDNTMSITRYDPNFAPTYLREKKALLKILKYGDKSLWDVADYLTTKGLESLKTRL